MAVAMGVAACIVGMGLVQQALVSWNREASPYGLSQNKRLNGRIADLFVSGPSRLSVRQYCWQHMRHHRYLGDPERRIDLMAWECIRGGGLYSKVARHLTGAYLFKLLRRYLGAQGSSTDARMPGRTGPTIPARIRRRSGLIVCAP